MSQWLRTDLGRSDGVTTEIQLVWLNWFTGTKHVHQPQKPCNKKDTHFNFLVNHPPYRDWGHTANQSEEVVKMWYINMYSNIILYQKYLMTSIKVGCATHSLYASQGSKAKRVPNNNQRGWGSGPCRLWGGLDKDRHIIPTALLVWMQCFRNDLYKAVKGSSIRPVVLSMIAGSNWRRRMRSTISSPMRWNSLRIWPS